MRLLERCSTLYTFPSVRVSRIRAKLVCLSITSKQAKVAPEGCHGIRGGNRGVPLQLVIAIYAEILFQCLVGSLCLTICLWMVSTDKVQPHIQDGT